MSFIIENWQLITGGIVSVFTFFGGQKMKKIEVKKADSEALTSMQQAYNEFVIDQKERYVEIKGELIYVREQTKRLQQDCFDLKSEVKDWKRKYNVLEKEVKAWKQKYNVLKDEFNDYKKHH